MLENLTPNSVFEIFEKICSIPHPSGKLDGICDYIEDYAKNLGLPCHRDPANNIVIKKSGKGTPLAFQAHTDMVCEKEPQCEINFDRDPITLSLSGDTVTAFGTTLGADDGIGVAMCLALLKENITLPLEIILTADEETGLMGAESLECSDLSAKHLINLDSEEEGIITVGCANGILCDVSLQSQILPISGIQFTVTVGGLKGGHSGTDINNPHQNAIKLLAFLLSKLPAMQLVDFCGGSRHSAIPRTAEAKFIVPISELKTTKYTLQKYIAEICAKYKSIEPDISICFDLKETEASAATKEESTKILSLLNELPHGVHTMSPYIDGLVESSNNAALANFDGNFLFTAMVRSSDSRKSREICDNIKKISQKNNANYREEFLYPEWEYEKNSELQDICVKCFEKLYGKTPTCEVIHAGLECGILSKKLGAKCVSIGPDMKNVHTTEEQLSVSSTARTYNYILSIIKEFEEQN